ncbi:hypothetical protein C8J56DRAFT_777132 [Mycena floridula]|nr:hypothetical protein C8J56DRAFT_777132 [Mycena floridula]
MARRSAPPNSGPSYIPRNPPARNTLTDPNESAFGRFLRTEVFAPEKRAGNISIATGVSLFLGGVAAIRLWGELIVPA